ncbi:hypothetical protein DFJ58DRAFT_739288 [Suillus subalutaceus]|uniref:uncharacterized protein n=1 Tax=Suillus subalutaceus TaxID=48586 RepID=UPI001B85DFCF|nr:uncharacterized protein DFJ58DRAFT_739288 [Suillus subalutaceus]KAG1820669.1 hypothetical protein DFJ58DRAFT_739288 [Suillus subalutaceus]
MEDRPILHSRGVDSRFGFVPPSLMAMTPKCNYSGALSRFAHTSSQPNTPEHTLTGANSRNCDNPCSDSYSDTSCAIAASKPVPPERTFTGAHSRKHDYPRSHSGCTQLVSKLILPQHTTTNDNNLPTDLDSDANADYVRPSRMDVSDAEAPLYGDEGYDTGRDHDADTNGSGADTNGSDADANSSDADKWNGVYADYDHGIDNVEDQDVGGRPDLYDPNKDHDTSDDSSNDEATCTHSRAIGNSRNTKDVLDDHHARNRRARIPDPDKLEHLRRRATTQDLAEPSKEEEVVVPRKRTWTVKSTAQNIRFYPPSWRDILEAAKKKLRLGLLTSTASKRSDFLQTKAIEYILETLDDFGSQGIGVDDGYWDEHKSDMAVLLWDDRATMRSEMKKVARPIVLAHYEILPHDIDDEDDCEWEVRDNVKTLLQDGSFLWDGVDALGRTNNLANKALGSFCMSYFYKGKNVLVKTFPDLFADAVPEGAVTLTATALAAAINKYKTGVYKQMKFVAELYQPIYDNVIKLYNNVKKDHYHAKKCRAARKKWACAAGILTRNDPNRRHDWGLKLQLD